MPWCPNCKTEYRFGITNCSDCKSPLVEELTLEDDKLSLVTFEAEKKEAAQRLVDFLLKESIDDVILTETEEGHFEVLVPESQKKRADKIFSVFSRIEAENEFSSLDEEEKGKRLVESLKKTEKAQNTHVYTKAAERYKENRSTAWTFCVVGVFGILFTSLNVTGILSIMSGTLQYIVSYLMFAGFIAVGLLSFSKTKHFQEMMEKEKNAEEEYKNWLRSLPMDKLFSVWNNENSPEENEIVLVHYLSESLVVRFPEINENFADTLADEYFNEIRENFI